MPRHYRQRRDKVTGRHERECSKCFDWQPETAEFFPVSPKGHLRSYCRKCNRGQARAWLRKQKEKLQSLAADLEPQSAGFTDQALCELQLAQMVGT